MATIALMKPTAAGTISGNQFRVQIADIAAAANLNGGDLVVGAAANQFSPVSLSASPAPTTKTIAGFAIHSAIQGTTWAFDPTVTASHPQGVYGGTFGGTFMGISNLLKSLEGVGVHVATADPDNIFEVSLATASGALAMSMIGALTGLVQDATSKFWIADTTQVNKVATIVYFRQAPQFGVIGDTQARVIIRFLNSVFVNGL